MSDGDSTCGGLGGGARTRLRRVKSHPHVPRRDLRVPRRDPHVPRSDLRVPRRDPRVPRSDPRVPRRDLRVPRTSKKDLRGQKKASEVKNVTPEAYFRRRPLFA